MTGHLSAPDVLIRLLSESRKPSAGTRQPQAVWNEVVATAVRHGFAPLLFKRLKESGARTNVPAVAWENLRLAYFASAGRNARLYRELGLVLRCLRGSGIPVIVLKGAFLAEAVYGDVALRPMGDVDLMVPRAEMPRAHAVLLDTGRAHQQSGDVGSRSGRSRKFRLSVGAGIDLCWTIVAPKGRFGPDSTGLWNRAHQATIAGVEVLGLCPEDLLLHLCLHASHRHGLTAGLRPFCDIAETIRHFRGAMDWAQVVHSAREWCASRYVGLTLHLAQSMVGAGVPDDVLERLVPGGIDQRIIEAARESVLTQAGYLQRMPFFGRLGVESLGDKAKLSWERIFLSRGEMAAIYPASRDSKYLYFHYALRLRDVIRAFVSHIRRRGRLMTRSRRHNRKDPLVNWLKSGEPRAAGGA